MAVDLEQTAVRAPRRNKNRPTVFLTQTLAHSSSPFPSLSAQRRSCGHPRRPEEVRRAYAATGSLASSRVRLRMSAPSSSGLVVVPSTRARARGDKRWRLSSLMPARRRWVLLPARWRCRQWRGKPGRFLPLSVLSPSRVRVRVGVSTRFDSIRSSPSKC